MCAGRLLACQLWALARDVLGPVTVPPRRHHTRLSFVARCTIAPHFITCLMDNSADVAAVVLELVRRRTETTLHRIAFNVACAETPTLAEFMSTVARHAGRPQARVHVAPMT